MNKIVFALFDNLEHMVSVLEMGHFKCKEIPFSVF